MKTIDERAVETVWMEAEICGVKVEGDVNFIKRTQKALQLIERTSQFGQIKPYLGIIRQTENGGIRIGNQTTIYEVGDSLSLCSPEWYASTIVHDGCRSLLYHQAREQSQGKKPKDSSWKGKEAERKCLQLQLAVLEQIPSGNYVLDYIKKQLTRLKG